MTQLVDGFARSKPHGYRVVGWKLISLWVEQHQIKSHTTIKRPKQLIIFFDLAAFTLHATAIYSKAYPSAMGGVWRGATAQSGRNMGTPVHQLETTKHRTTKNVAGGRDAVCQSRRQDGIDRGCDSGGRRRGGGVLVKRVVMVEGETSSAMVTRCIFACVV